MYKKAKSNILLTIYDKLRLKARIFYERTFFINENVKK